MGLGKGMRDAILEICVEKAKPILREAAIEFEDKLKRNLDTLVGEPSKKGQFPAYQSGTLYKSISLENKTSSRRILFVVKIGKSVGYADKLEVIRPYFQRTIDEEGPKILKKMQERWDKASGVLKNT